MASEAPKYYIVSMNTLTPLQLRARAPATRKLPRRDPSLIDTADFLRDLRRQGYEPVNAFQGKPHADANTAAIGRHMVVTRHLEDDIIIALLNNHTSCKRAWVGVGYGRLLGAVLPFPRWKGYQSTLNELDQYWPQLESAQIDLTTRIPDEEEKHWIVERLARALYLPKNKPAAPGPLMPPPGLRAIDVLHHVLDRVLEGNLEPADGGRKLKPLKGPDALFHAHNAAWVVGIEALRKFKGRSYVFPKVGTAHASPSA